MTKFDVDSYSDWRRFVGDKGDFAPKIVSPLIIDSWKRSQEYGVDPFSSGFQSVSPGELERRRSVKVDLCKVATPYINNLYEVIKGSGSLIILSDEDGVIIDLATDTVSHSIRNFPEAGTIQSESVVGTNGIGTSLACGSLVQIRGAEHWLLDNHSWTCSAAPIAIKGRIIGCLNLSTPSKKQNSLSLGLITSAVTAIVRELELSSTLEEVRFLTHQQNAVLKLMENGVIIVTRSGSVIQANDRAHSILNDYRNWKNKPISDLIKCNIDFMNIFESKTMLDSHEINIQLRDKNTHLHVSTELINSGESTAAMAIMFFESKKMLKMVNKIAGSKAHFHFHDILGSSSLMGDCIFLAKQAAKNGVTVLIMGESGTGKELIAQSIHNGSDRKDQPFIAVNCGALSRELILSELFGYEGGAFTGAKCNGNPGKFELADGGTIFLDEIGELPLESQVALLRVLQTREITRIGSAKTISIDVRVITATNKDLTKCVMEKSFREDLFFRINILTIKLPPLRDRNGDIRLLIDFFINRYHQLHEKQGVRLTDETYALLEQYSWPGNIRQLENVLERAVTICNNNEITPKELPTEIIEENDVIGGLPVVLATKMISVPQETQSTYTSLEQIQRDFLKRQLHETNGNLRKLAEKMGVSRSTLYRLLHQYHLNQGEYRMQSTKRCVHPVDRYGNKAYLLSAEK